MNKTTLDMCYGSRIFWHDKQYNSVVFSDIRNKKHILCDGRLLTIAPDVIADFKNLPFLDNTFHQVVFDPLHLLQVGKNSWLFKKYGSLNKFSWKEDLSQGFKEAFRVLKKKGTLLFKWNETQIPTRQILALTNNKPIIVQRFGKNDKTHWIVFMK